VIFKKMLSPNVSIGFQLNFLTKDYQMTDTVYFDVELPSARVEIGEPALKTVSWFLIQNFISDYITERHDWDLETRPFIVYVSHGHKAKPEVKNYYRNAFQIFDNPESRPPSAALLPPSGEFGDFIKQKIDEMANQKSRILEENSSSEQIPSTLDRYEPLVAILLRIFEEGAKKRAEQEDSRFMNID